MRGIERPHRKTASSRRGLPKGPDCKTNPIQFTGYYFVKQLDGALLYLRFPEAKDTPELLNIDVVEIGNGCHVYIRYKKPIYDERSFGRHYRKVCLFTEEELGAKYPWGMTHNRLREEEYPFDRRHF